MMRDEIQFYQDPELEIRNSANSHQFSRKIYQEKKLLRLKREKLRTYVTQAMVETVPLTMRTPRLTR